MVLLTAVMQTGCGASTRLEWLKELGTLVALGGFRWSVAAGLIGLVVAVVLLWGLRRNRTRESTGSTTAKLVDLFARLAFLVLFPAGIAYMGFFEGMLRASSHELSEGDFAQKYFPIIGGAGADLVGIVLLSGDLKTVTGGSPKDLEALRVAFRSGEREIATSQIPVLIAAIDGDFVREVSDGIKSDAIEQFPGLAAGSGRHLLDWFMDNFSDALVRSTFKEGLERRGLGSFLDLFGAMVRQLPEAAARDGSPETLSHRETAEFLVQVAISNGVIKYVIRPFCRAHQLGALLSTFGASCIALILLRRREPVQTT